MRVLRLGFTKYILIVWFIFTGIWSGIMMQNAMRRLERSSGSKDMLDLMPNNSAGDVYQYMNDISDGGRKVLRGIYTFEDFVFPMAYGPFLFLAIGYFFYKSFPNKKNLLWFCISPILGVCFDYIENFSIVNIIDSYPHQISSATTLGKITLAKWITAGSSGLLLLISFSLFIVKRFVQKK